MVHWESRYVCWHDPLAIYGRTDGTEGSVALHNGNVGAGHCLCPQSCRIAHRSFTLRGSATSHGSNSSSIQSSYPRLYGERLSTMEAATQKLRRWKRP